MKKFTDFINLNEKENPQEQEPEQIDESTLAHRGDITIKDGKLDSGWLNVVSKTSGPGSNMEISFQYGKRGSSDLTSEINLTSGRFNKDSLADIFELADQSKRIINDVEKAFSKLSRTPNLDDKKIKSEFGKIGFNKIMIDVA